MRRLLPVVFAVLLPVPALAAASPGFALRAGEAVLWDGPFVRSATGDQRFTYRVDVVEPGYRLRVGIDHPQVGDVFAVNIDGPDGDAASFSVGPGIYSDERFIYTPDTGTWRIEVIPRSVTESAFRVRVKLEARPPSLGTRHGPVLPNLQILPPHDASFMLPVTNGSADTDPTGVETAGLEGCHPEEHVEDQAVRCMRFGFGVRNTGLGPLDLYHTGTSPLEHDLFQRVHHADGSIVDRPAGRAVFHKTHGHWHHGDAVAVQLFRVIDAERGVLEPAGAKRTKGFAHRNELLRDWDVFYPTLDHEGFGLRPGWADIYEWDRPGNYIAMGGNLDGEYVVRMWADPVDGIREMNEHDNLGYTYLRVAGGDVELIEAGRGRHPWDPCRIVVGFGGFPDPPRVPRPARCAPDTT